MFIVLFGHMLTYLWCSCFTSVSL